MSAASAAARAAPGPFPECCANLFRPEGEADFFATRAWYDTVLAAALPPAARPCFLVAPSRRVVLPLLLSSDGRGIGGLTTPYTCRFEPLAAPGQRDAELEAAGAGLARFLRDWGTVRLDALPEDSPILAPLLRGMRRCGTRAVRFAHFGNWHEPLGGRGWTEYLAARDGAIRETVRRKLRAVDRDPTIRFELVATEAGIDSAVAAYESVYARSWKEPEPFPAFNAALIRAAAHAGVLRLGLLRVGEQPVAAQLWIVSGGTAYVLKLAHDEAFRALSPGTVLTARMMRLLIDTEHVAELDFGRGDDPYKRLWATRRRQRVGVVLVNPRRASGLAFLARHGAGRLRRLFHPVAG